MTAILHRIGSAATIAIATVALLSSAAPPPAAAQPVTGEACVGVKHGDISSTIVLAASSNLDQGTDVSVMLEIDGRTIEGFGFVDDNGRFGLVIIIKTYGKYNIVSITATTREGDRLTLPADSFGVTTITVGPDEITCSTEQLTPLAPLAPTPTPEPTGTEASAPSPTTTTPTTTTSPTTAPSTAGSGTSIAAQTDGGSGFPLLPAFLIIGGLLIALLGAFFFWGGWPLFGGRWPLAVPTRTRRQRSTPRREPPTVITPEARDVIQGIYAGAASEGVQIAGLARVVETSDTLTGSKASPGVNIGQTVEISVALDADGKPIPRIEDRDEFQPASSVMTIRVTPHREYGGEFWHASVQIWDVDTARLEYGQSSGATNAQRTALIDGRSEVEYGNDPDFHEAMLEFEADSVEDAVAQALRGAASGGNVVPPPR